MPDRPSVQGDGRARKARRSARGSRWWGCRTSRPPSPRRRWRPSPRTGPRAPRGRRRRNPPCCRWSRRPLLLIERHDQHAQEIEDGRHEDRRRGRMARVDNAGGDGVGRVRPAVDENDGQREDAGEDERRVLAHHRKVTGNVKKTGTGHRRDPAPFCQTACQWLTRLHTLIYIIAYCFATATVNFYKFLQAFC